MAEDDLLYMSAQQAAAMIRRRKLSPVELTEAVLAHIERIAPLNALHPALTLPSGFAADGLPTAVQIVGRWGADMDVLRLGALLEEARPWSGKRPPLPR
jgi:Asp-tRNA(Asn)/Glu-tRNA(Gln) amidotransferase A subunit family amidase